jgi:hypothetical protein
MANLITLTAIGKNGIAKPSFTVAVNVSQIKSITAETKDVPTATSTVYVFDTKASGSTTDYQVATLTVAQLVTLANANAIAT